LKLTKRHNPFSNLFSHGLQNKKLRRVLKVLQNFLSRPKNMPRKRAWQGNPDASVETFGTFTIVTGFENVVLPECKGEVISSLTKIQLLVSQIMTLATKLGSMFLLEYLNQSPSIPSFCKEQVFWALCTKVVSSTSAEPQDRTVSEERASVERQLRQTWADFKQGSSVPNLSRDHIVRFLDAQVVTYITNVKVYIATTLEKRMWRALHHQANELLQCHGVHQLATLKEESELRSMLASYMFNMICGEAVPHWQGRRQALADEFLTPPMFEFAQTLVQLHRSFIPFLPPEPFSQEHKKILQALGMDFLPYLRYLVQYQKHPFVILPQWDAKARHIVLNRHTCPEWARFSNHPKWLPQIKGGAWSEEQAQALFASLFKIPRTNLQRKAFANCITTDLVKISWQFQRARTSSNESSKRQKVEMKAADEVRVVSAQKLGNGLHHHGFDFYLDTDSKTLEDVNFVFIDPGHANIMSGVRQYKKEDFNARTAMTSKDEKGRRTMLYKYTNCQNMFETGFAKRRRRAQGYRDHDASLKTACDALTANSCKTWDPGTYRQHFAVYCLYWQALFNHAFRSYVRHFRFANYRASQRRVCKIASQLCPQLAEQKKRKTQKKMQQQSQVPEEDQIPQKTIVVIGNGVRTATSRGYDAAPGKMLRRQLALHMPIIMTDERCSTITCSNCHERVHHGLHNGRHKNGWNIRGLVHCHGCGNTFDRDFNAALNIRTIFWWQAQQRQRTLPFS
jgi:hypothetical protein